MTPDTQFGDRWKVVRQIGEGCQAWIYEVQDVSRSHEGPAILKRLKNHNRLGRFEREIKATNALNHPAIPQIIDYSLKKPAFFVTPIYRGSNLKQIAPLAALPAIDIFIQICEVIAYAHSQGVVHRDIKPENILFTFDGKVVVLDFGLSYFLEEDEDRLTETMEQVGSRFFIAPELEAGRAH